MNHIPTLSNAIYTCDQCTFRAVQTTRGPYVMNNGAGRDLHLAAIVSAQAEQRAHVARVLSRIRIYELTGNLTEAQSQRIAQCVRKEFEG